MRDDAVGISTGLAALDLLRLRFGRAHMVGIGGAGMAALAEILHHGGLEVGGSDPNPGRATAHLARLGIAIVERHAKDNVPARGLVVHSAAIAPSNPELRAARRNGLPVLARGELLALLLRGSCGVAVAGAHGKSTTSGMCALVLEEAGMRPWAAIGARIPGRPGNALHGASPLLVAEVDESDGTIDRADPWIAVITNVDREHLDRYASFAALKRSFAGLAARVPVAGTVVACADDRAAVAATRNVSARRLVAGLATDADVRGTEVDLRGGLPRFTVRHGQRRVARVRLQVPGAMNVRNALLAATVGIALGAPARAIKAGLERFTGMGRRFELRGTVRGITVVDDYAHHPTEIAATLAAARQLFSRRRLLVLFEPHRPSRLAAHLVEFARALAAADQVVVAPLFGAYEKKAGGGVGAPELAARIRRLGTASEAAQTVVEATTRTRELARAGDTVLVLGAGKAERMADVVVAEIAKD